MTPDASGTFQIRLNVQSTATDGASLTLDKKYVDIDAVVVPEPTSDHVDHFINSPLGLTLLGTVLAFVLGLVVAFVTTRRKNESNA